MTPTSIRLIAAACLLMILGAMAWATHSLLQMEKAQWILTGEATIHEKTRLALWRMETIASSLVVEESSRPPEHYRSFAAPDQSYTGAYGPVPQGTLVVPSPLLTGPPARILLHFEVDSYGQVRSPEVPEGEERAIALQQHITAEELATATERLVQLRSLLSAPPKEAHFGRYNFFRSAWQYDSNSELLVQENSILLPAPDAPERGLEIAQTGSLSSRNDQLNWSLREAEVRQQVIENAKAAVLPQRSMNLSRSAYSRSRPGTARDASPPATTAGSSPMQEPKLTPVDPRTGTGVERVSDVRPFWIGDALLLTRVASGSGGSVLQGAWIDWNSLCNELLEAVRDLFPDASLTPESGTEGGELNLLASLPVRFTTGPLNIPAIPAWSPLRFSLAAAWICIGLATAAGGIMLNGMLALSDRRAAFVSSVTHELRTPLATFKLYSDMLAGGLVRDPAKQQVYLETLTAEADRLGHLVENVLAYSRLEGGRKPAPFAELDVIALCGDMEPHLQSRATQGNASLSVSIDSAASRCKIRTDPSAIRQILFNLIDNACKYGHRESEPAGIHIRVSRDGPSCVAIAVTDDGPGVPPGEARRLFRAFHKSARDAAHSGPGIGLGLALSRRLARELGGSLRIDPRTTKGACFVLTLPASCDSGERPATPA